MSARRLTAVPARSLGQVTSVGLVRHLDLFPTLHNKGQRFKQEQQTIGKLPFDEVCAICTERKQKENLIRATFTAFSRLRV